AQVDAIEQDPCVWAAKFAIERKVSPIDAYRRHYDVYVALWRDALAGASDAPADARLVVTARVAHALCYGWVSQSLLS
ncbi:TetR/AcrR family transcriptional regulator, partial [Burkholderia pseudomallei]